MSITWSTEDVQHIRPDLSDEQAFEVLESVLEHHDADIGVCWEALEFWASQMFPKKAVSSYTVEITETLQRQITVDAQNAEAALALVKRAYKNSEYILDADNFVSVVFNLLDEMGEQLG